MSLSDVGCQKDMKWPGLAIVKLGGSVITFKSESPPKTNFRALQRIAKEIKCINTPLVLVLGGGSHGHQAAKHYGFDTLSSPVNLRMKGIPFIRHNMTLLSIDVQSVFQDNGVPAVVIPPFCTTILKQGSISHYFLDSLANSLDAGFVVITHGDVCYDQKYGAHILSGDTLVRWLADKLAAELVLVGTDVDGIFDLNPHIFPDASLIERITPSTAEELLPKVGPSSSVDVTGGMSKKLSEFIALAKKGHNVVIFNLTCPGRLKRLLQQEDTICTRITL